MVKYRLAGSVKHRLILVYFFMKVTSNFKEKAKHFNAFFPSQRTPITNDSMKPLVTTAVTNASLSSILFKDHKFLKIIHSSSINKAHRYDDISISFLRICDSSIVRPQ